MIKLKISYEHEEDLARILTVLRPMIIRCKKVRQYTGTI